MMKRGLRSVALLPGLFVLFAGAVAAQGVTTSAVAGTVRGPDGQPVASAQVSVINVASGVQTGALAGQDGRYFVAHLSPGGPYTVEVSSIGFETQRREGIRLALGQTLRLNFDMSTQAIQLEGLVVQVDEVFSQDRTGQQTIVTSEQIDALPVLTRNFTELASLSPLVSGGVGASVGGQNNRFNNIQIDGAVNNDVFGLAASGVPGGQANAKPISQDAIAEFQVLVAPFDVRQAGFTGGLINAVTKSGTNEFHGSLSGYLRNESLLRETLTVDGTDFTFSEFDEQVLAFTLGGPIQRDKIHFFVSGEFERFNNPVALGIESGSNGLDLDPNSISRVEQVANGYGLDFGRTSAYTRGNPKRNLFGRLDFQLSPTQRLSVKHKYDAADQDDGPSRGGGFFEPESATYDFLTDTHTSVAQLFSQFGEWSNELLVTAQFVRDSRAPASEFAFSTIRVDVPDDAINDGATIQFGAERFSHANRLDQNIYQVTNNLTRTFGAHRATFGVAFERYGFDNLFADRSLGQYDFDSVEDFQNGVADFFAIRLPHPSLGTSNISDVSAKFAYNKFGAYVQDEYQANDQLSLTFGLRVDVPVTSDEPRNNPDFQSTFGFPTTEVPSGNLLIQPRVGFNYQFESDQRMQLRGGAGVFAGRPPFVWISNGFGNTGRETLELRCFSGNTPAFNPNSPPTSCADGAGPSAARASIAALDPDFKFPQEFKLNLAIDREFGDGWRATFEGIYTKSIDAMVVEELNGTTPLGTTSPNLGVGTRTVYGTAIDSSDNPWDTQLRNGDNFFEVVRLTNDSKGYSYNLIAELEKNWDGKYNVSGSYKYGRSYDIQSFTSSRAISNWGFNPVGSSVALADREVTPSNFDRPHGVIFTASGNFLPEYGGTNVAFIYRGGSGRSYQYVYDGDVNGDGFAGELSSSRTNDLVYIPNNSSEIAFRDAEDERLFNEMVELDSCLSESRGMILERNSCRAPWTGQLDMRLTQGVNTPQGKVEVLFDVFNVLNLLSESWGIQEGPTNNTVQLLRTRGRENDDPNGRILFTYDGFRDTSGSTTRAELPYTTFTGASRWQARLGLRFVF